MDRQMDQAASIETEANLQSKHGHIVVSVCTTCKSEEADSGQSLLQAAKAAIGKTNVTVRAVQCLGVCKRPGTVAITAPDGYTFVFGDLQGETGAAAISAFVSSYAQANYGLVPWRERAEVLRRGLVARIPPAIWSPEDGSPPK
jgi:predicted metal-binding protein